MGVDPNAAYLGRWLDDFDLGWVAVAGLSVVGAFDEFVADCFAFDYAWVAAESSFRVGAFGDLTERFGEWFVILVRGESPRRW